MSDATDLARRFPAIRWREPIKVTRSSDGVSGFACRICVAVKGLKGDEIQNLYRSVTACERHIERAHPQ